MFFLDLCFLSYTFVYDLRISEMHSHVDLMYGHRTSWFLIWATNVDILQCQACESRVNILNGLALTNVDSMIIISVFSVFTSY